MKTFDRNPSIRQGQFLWMDKQSRKSYIATLKKRMKEGFYSSEKVITHIVDELAPVLNDTIEKDNVIRYI